VLIGFAESLAAIESAWSLIDAGYEVIAFTRAGRQPPLAVSRSVEVVAVPSPEQDADACVAALRELVTARRPDAVLPLDDQAVWLCDQLGGGTVIAGPTGPQARLALDKHEQLTLADKAGLLIPPTAVSGVDSPPGDGPWMVKPAAAVVVSDGRLKRPTGNIATDRAEVDRIAANLDGTVLVQPVIDGVGEGVFGLAIDGQVYALSGHRRVRMMNPRGSGSSACRSIPIDPTLVEPTRAFVAAAGWHGIFMLELLRDAAGRPWVMELNGRTWGSMALARRRGLEYPLWAVETALDEQWRPPAVPEAPHILARHLGRELVHLLAVMCGGRGADAGRWPGRMQTVRAMLRREPGTGWYNARRGERRVFVRDTWQTVMAQVRRR
jgi:hypothetical protein